MIVDCQKNVTKLEREGDSLNADSLRKHLKELIHANGLMKDKLAKLKKA